MVLRELEAAQGRVAAVAPEVAPVPAPSSVLSGFLKRAYAIAAAEGARLTVVLLPLDVQVSPDEWAKYGEEPKDLSGSLVLLDEVAAEADRLGITVVEPLLAFREAEPGAFLHGDLHLSAIGQQVLAEQIAARLSAPPLPAWPEPGLPPGRNRVPLPVEWAVTRENLVRGSSALGCGTWQIREWVKISCKADTFGTIGLGDAPLETMVRTQVAADGPGRLTLVAPVLEGRRVVADFVWSDHAARLVLEAGHYRFEALTGGTTEPLGTIPEPDAECPLPDDWIGNMNLGCYRLETCEERLQCADGRRLALPPCRTGEVNAGSAGYCVDRCDTANPCEHGVCTPWMGAAVCL